MSVPVKIQLGAPDLRMSKTIFLAAAPREGDYIEHTPGWAAMRCRTVIICPDYVLVEDAAPITDYRVDKATGRGDYVTKLKKAGFK